jgi:hypothetical protein
MYSGFFCEIFLSADLYRLQQWTIENMSIFSNSSHLEWRAGPSDIILKGTHQGTIPARFGLIWFSGFREEEITFKSSPLKPMNQIKSNLAGMVPGWIPFKIMLLLAM